MTLVVVIDRRFYKNFYGAEGYFTLSLPVKISTHIWSKVIASTVWMVITAFVGIFIMMIVSIVTNGPDSYHQIKVFMNEMPAEARAIIIFLFEVLLLGVVYVSRFLLKTLAIEVIGHLCGDFALNLAVNGNQIRIAQYGVGGIILLQVVECAIYFLASNYLMKNRLNLE